MGGASRTPGVGGASRTPEVGGASRTPEMGDFPRWAEPWEQLEAVCQVGGAIVCQVGGAIVCQVGGSEHSSYCNIRLAKQKMSQPLIIAGLMVQP